MAELHNSENKETRKYIIGLLGKVIKYCVETRQYPRDRTKLFNLLEAHLFDKATSCRKRAFELMKINAYFILDIIDAEGALKVYKSVLNAVTDIKPSIRKAAVEVI